MKRFIHNITGHGILLALLTVFANSGGSLSTLHAEEGNTYVVTFNANGGSPAPKNKTVTSGVIFDAPAAMTKNGHLFGGWYADATFTGETYDFTAPHTITGDFTLYAKWNPETYVVTYHLNYPDAPPSTTRSVIYPQTKAIPLSPEPKRDGYVLKGWSLDANATVLYPFTANLTTNIALYAVWRQLLTVTLEHNYPEAPPAEMQEIEAGTSFEKPTNPTRTGYVFDAWYPHPDTEEGVPVTFPLLITANQTLYASWTANTYLVTFNANGGLPLPFSPLIVPHDIRIEKPAEMTRTGYTFGGWYTAYNMPYTFDAVTGMSDPIRSALTLTARWNINTYIITFHYNYPDSLFDSDDGFTERFSYGDFLNEQEHRPPLLFGYAFIGWYSKAVDGARWDFEHSPITGASTLYAHWSPVTSLDFIPDGDANASAYYDLQGHRVAHPEKGRLYIIIYSDGARRLIVYQK